MPRHWQLIGGNSSERGRLCIQPIHCKWERAGQVQHSEHSKLRATAAQACQVTSSGAFLSWSFFHPAKPLISITTNHLLDYQPSSQILLEAAAGLTSSASRDTKPLPLRCYTAAAIEVSIYRHRYPRGFSPLFRSSRPSPAWVCAFLILQTGHAHLFDCYLTRSGAFTGLSAANHPSHRTSIIVRFHSFCLHIDLSLQQNF